MIFCLLRVERGICRLADTAQQDVVLEVGVTAADSIACPGPKQDPEALERRVGTV